MQKIPKDWGGLVLNSLITQEPPQSLGANHPHEPKPVLEKDIPPLVRVKSPQDPLTS